MKDYEGEASIEKIWGRLKAKYIDPKQITAVTKDEMAKQIKKLIEDAPKPENPKYAGNAQRLIDSDFHNDVVEKDNIRREITQNNFEFKEYIYRGKPALGIFQKHGDPIDHKFKPPRRATWTTQAKADREGFNIRTFLNDKLKSRFDVSIYD